MDVHLDGIVGIADIAAGSHAEGAWGREVDAVSTCIVGHVGSVLTDEEGVAVVVSA